MAVRGRGRIFGEVEFLVEGRCFVGSDCGGGDGEWERGDAVREGRELK